MSAIRGYTAKETAIWRDVLEHFDAVKIGLTATPAPHSLSLFNEVIYYRYTTNQAIQGGYLVDYEAVRIKSDVRLNGVFLKEGDHVGIIDTETGEEIYDQLEDEREFPTEDIERKITAPQWFCLIIAYLKTRRERFSRFSCRTATSTRFCACPAGHLHRIAPALRRM